MYVSMRDTYTICGAGEVSVSAIPDLVVVLGDISVIFAVICLTLQLFRVSSLAVIFIEYMYANLRGRLSMTLSLFFSTYNILWLALLVVGLLFG